SVAASFLLVLPDLQPDFEQLNAVIHDVFFDLRDQPQKTSMVVFAAETHDVFDAGPVVPAAVEDHDLARCRKLLNITLPEHLCFLAIRGCRQRHHAKHARAHAFGDGFDGPALPGRVATLEHDDDARSLGLDPLLQMAKFDLQLLELALVRFAFHLLLGIAACRPFQLHDLTLFLPGDCAWTDRYRPLRPPLSA